MALANAGRYLELEARARHFLEMNPGSGIVTKILALALWAQGKEALPYFKRAVELLPDDAEAHGNLGNALRALGRFREAANSHRRALEIAPDTAETHNNLGSALLDLGLLVEAAAQFRRAVALKPEFALAHGNLAHVLVLQNQIDDAEASCRRALELCPALTGAIVQLAELEAARGRFEIAEDFLRRALAIEPDLPEALAGLVRWRKITHGDRAWLDAAQRVARLPLAPRRKVLLHHAMGKYFDDVADYERAFQNYRTANDLARASGPAYDRSEVSRTIDLLILSQDRDWLTRTQVEIKRPACPVFIVGMPRSGTTLAEQMLSSHAAIFGAGELPFWSTAAASYGASRATAATERDLLGRLGDEYLISLRRLSREAPRVVDKMPGNFFYLGLIHAALPEARFIHLVRSPIDTCLSIYFQHFGAGHPYANDLDDLAHYYTEYVRVMNHWRDTLPPEVLLEVSYEGIVQDAEGSGRRMLEFVGQSWDPACLDFHLSTRPVNTHSKWQARQKISNASVGRWRHYERFVGPLRELIKSDNALGLH